MIAILNDWSQAWIGLLLAVVWQSTLVALIIAGVCLLLRRSAPAVRYWLWQIVAIKLLLMPFWSASIPWPSFMTPEPAAVDQEAMPATGNGGATIPFQQPPLLPVGERTSESSPQPSEPVLAWLWEMTWPSWLLLVWLAVVLWQVANVFRMRWRLHNLLRQSCPADAAIVSLLNEVSGQLNLRRPPAVLVTDTDASPFVCGVRRPVLVLPKSMLASLEQNQLRQVLLHELAHVKRRDLLWGWIPEIARMIYWFHPVAYWAAYRIRLERELACDQIAMAASQTDAAGYAETLVQVVAQASRPAVLKAAAVGSAGLSGGTISEQKHESHPTENSQ